MSEAPRDDAPRVPSNPIAAKAAQEHASKRKVWEEKEREHEERQRRVSAVWEVWNLHLFPLNVPHFDSSTGQELSDDEEVDRLTESIAAISRAIVANGFGHRLEEIDQGDDAKQFAIQALQLGAHEGNAELREQVKDLLHIRETEVGIDAFVWLRDELPHEILNLNPSDDEAMSSKATFHEVAAKASDTEVEASLAKFIGFQSELPQRLPCTIATLTSPSTTMAPTRLAVLNVATDDIAWIDGDTPQVCQYADPTLKRGFVAQLPKLVDELRNRGFGQPGQTILWIGRNASATAACTYCSSGCECFQGEVGSDVLVSSDQIARMVDLEPNSFKRHKKCLRKPFKESSGRSAAKWKLSEAVEDLKNHFSEDSHEMIDRVARMLDQESRQI